MSRIGNKRRFCLASCEKKVEQANRSLATAWSGWRGLHRNGRVAWLPDSLPQKTTPLWAVETSSPGLGGVAATSEHVYFSDRGLNDSIDEWKCLSAVDGKELWVYRYPCKGNLDFGNSPRATPFIDGDFVYTFGAFGHLACLNRKTGEPEWEMNLPDEFEATDKPKWGACSSPLLADGKLIVNPGAKNASLVALDPKTGKVLWKTPGRAAGYGSLIAGTFGGVLQIVGHDTDSLGGWDVKTGRRLWTVKPPNPNDFNVPTPIEIDGKLLVTTENNGTRLFQFKTNGVIDQKPVATNRKLSPDTHTPVVVGDHIFGVWRRIFCLSASDPLKAVWDADDQAFARYAAIVATANQVMVISQEAELILFDSEAPAFTPKGRLKLLLNEKGLYSHPAFVGSRIYVRGSSSMLCFDWKK